MKHSLKQVPAIAAAALFAMAGSTTVVLADEGKGWMCETLGVFCPDDSAKSDS